MRSLKDYSDGHLVVMAESEEQVIEKVKEEAIGDKEPLGHHFGKSVYDEVKKIFDGETSDYRKPNVSEKPRAAAFVGSA